MLDLVSPLEVISGSVSNIGAYRKTAHPAPQHHSLFRTPVWINKKKRRKKKRKGEGGKCSEIEKLKENEFSNVFLPGECSTAVCVPQM